MSYRKFNQHSETAVLKKVVIGRPQGYRADERYVEIVNKDQKRGLPDEAKLMQEFSSLRKVLESEGVEVIQPEYVGKFVYDQLTPRDIGVTIGNRFLICNMAKRSRRYEITGIFNELLQMQGPEPCLLIPGRPDALMEGGDLIIDQNTLFVGLSGRTNEKGLEYLRSTFGDEFEVVPVPCGDVLHLDCAFNPVGKNLALIYPEGLQEIPRQIKNDYEWLEVDAGEQAALATNVLSINEETVISRDHPDCKRVNALMRKCGIRVIELSFDGAPATGGSLRCCSLPLMRK